MSFITRSGSQFRLDGKRFRFVGVDHYQLVVNVESQATVQAFLDAAKAKGISVIRTWCFDAGYLPTNSAGNFRYLVGATLTWREAGFVQLDMVLDEARQRGIKLILSLADDPSYNTKNTYIRWSDAIYGTDYFTPVSKSVSSLSRASNTVTATTSSAHGYAIGQLVDVAGMTPSDMGGTSLFIRSVPSSTSFTYVASGADGSATGTITVIRNAGYLHQNFFRDANCKQMYKDFFAQLANRVNTINGRTYKNDDTVFSWELGNELRYGQANDPGINGTTTHNVSVLSGLPSGSVTQSWQYATSWAKEMADYFKSVDSNHLVGFGSSPNLYTDSYYGIDANLIPAIANIDYLDFHTYPTQGGDGTQLQGFCNPYPQFLQGYIAKAKAAGKPCIIGEVGFVKEVTCSNADYPLYPRHNAFKKIFQDVLDADADGVLLWNGETSGGGSYSVNLNDTGGEGTTDNTNDTKLVSLIAQRNYQSKAQRIPVDAVRGISI